MGMAVELTAETIDAVIFCMENQRESFLFDTESLRCVPASAAKGQEERLIRIPEWTAAHGFALMEEFAGSVKNPVLQKKLHEAISARTGVFRRFKDVLAEYPEFDRAWRAFKRERLKAAVLEWLGEFLQSESLNALGDEPEETAEIVQSDFAFLQKKPGGDLRRAFEAIACGVQIEEACARADIESPSFEEILAGGAAEVLENVPEGARAACALLFARLLSGEGEQILFCAETSAGDKAAALLAEGIEGAGKKSLVILGAAVLPAFRGMGLFTQLLDAAALSAEKGKRALACAMPMPGRLLLPALERANAVLCFAPFIC